MTESEYRLLPEKQKNALVDLWERSGYSWQDFLVLCLPPTTLAPYVGIKNFHGMFVGVETDGYTHS